MYSENSNVNAGPNPLKYDVPFLNCQETPLLIYLLSEEHEAPYGEDWVFTCEPDGTVATSGTIWTEWSDVQCDGNEEMPGHKPCYCNQEGTQKRARENI